MKFTALFVVFVAFATVIVAGSSYGGGSGGSSYGGASIPAPPCPKNYLFSCQPSLSPAPCAQQSSGGYGSAGGYSENIPTYVHVPPQLTYAAYQGVQGPAGYVQGIHY